MCHPEEEEMEEETLSLATEAPSRSLKNGRFITYKGAENVCFLLIKN